MPDSLRPLPVDEEAAADTSLADMGVIQRLLAVGLRPTRQRVGLARLLFRCNGTRHVTAEQLHAEAQIACLPVSLATVYNSLNQFRDAGLLREVVVAPGCTWFDTNTDDHHHFLYEDSGRLQDIDAKLIDLPPLPLVPDGKQVARIDVIIRLKDQV